jgi:hypothetical protein
MEPLLRWLHAGNRGYMHGHADTNTPNTKAINCTSSGAFADDPICLFGSYQNLWLQAMKITQYADWAHLIIAGKKTKVTCITIAMRTIFCVATLQWPTLHTTSWPTRS